MFENHKTSKHGQGILINQMNPIRRQLETLVNHKIRLISHDSGTNIPKFYKKAEGIIVDFYDSFVLVKRLDMDNYHYPLYTCYTYSDFLLGSYSVEDLGELTLDDISK